MTKKRPISEAQNTIHSFFKPTGNVNTNVAPLSDVEPVERDSLSEVVQLQAESNVDVLKVEVNAEPIQVDLEDYREQHSSKIQRLEPEEVKANSFFERDPGLRALIYKYPVNQQDHVRQSYLEIGPYRPILKPFPPTFDGKQNCRFKSDWYDQCSWLEYSTETDSAFCFPCYIFETSPPKYKAFTIDGFKSWKRVNGSTCSLQQHVGEINSAHMKAVGQCNDLKNNTQHIDKVLNTQSQDEILKWRLRLTVSIECLRLIALQGLAFRGHDESNESDNRGNFLEYMKFQGKMNSKIGDVILENAPKNAQYTSPRIQKDLLNLLAERVRRQIREEVGDAKYCILVDEAQDSSIKEKMALVLRIVDRGGLVRERFFKVVSVKDTSALTLKEAICSVLSHCNLQVDSMRGQGYDRASNMRGAWNGLQSLFFTECPSAYYVPCFAHRLQLALVASSKQEPEIWKFFSYLGTIVNLVVGSSKRQSELQGSHADEIEELLILGELDTGKGANQMCNLQRPGATR